MAEPASGSDQPLSNPYCHGMQEHPSAATERAKLFAPGATPESRRASAESDPLALHLSFGLAYTVGSALGSIPPSTDACRAAFVAPNAVGLTAGARAWSKHAHRSQIPEVAAPDDRGGGWWGTASGPVAVINEKAVALFWKVMQSVTWRNLHWLPHQILVYEVRVAEGYGMRWSQDRSAVRDSKDQMPEWVFRGFVEPMMEGGHEVGWRH